MKQIELMEQHLREADGVADLFRIFALSNRDGIKYNYTSIPEGFDRQSKSAFDKAYVANEVAYHKTVDTALETQLIPSSSNAELKSLLQTGLKIFQGHEQHAEQISTSLK